MELQHVDPFAVNVLVLVAVDAIQSSTITNVTLAAAKLLDPRAQMCNVRLEKAVCWFKCNAFVLRVLQ